MYVSDKIETLGLKLDNNGVRHPEVDAVLWRFMNFKKFIMLLKTQSVFFARPSAFDDSFEGAFTKKAYELHKNSIEEKKLKYPFSNVSISQYARAKDSIYISCWHQSPHESDAMWRLYGQENESIAIKTTVRKVTDSLANNIGCTPMYVAQVQYIDYNENLGFLGCSPTRIEPWLYKRINFEYEKEVRFILDDPFDFLSKRATKWEPAPNEWGVPIFCDIRQMIEEIHVSPYAEEDFYKKVRRELREHNLLPSLCVRSSMGDSPLKPS